MGIEEGVDGMVHKSDLSWTAKVVNPSDLYHKGDDVEAIILSINHDEKKVSLGIKQLFDDPWPTIFSDFPPGKEVDSTVMSVCDYGVFVRVQEGIEGLIPQSELVAEEGHEFKVGDAIKAEIANLDSTERRMTLSMRIGEGAQAAQAQAAAQKRTTQAPKAKVSSEGGNTIGDLIKQKLGASLGFGKKDDEEK